MSTDRAFFFGWSASPTGFGPNENHVLSGPLQCLVVHTKHIPWPLRALSKGAIWRSPKDFWLHEFVLFIYIFVYYSCHLRSRFANIHRGPIGAQPRIESSRVCRISCSAVSKHRQEWLPPPYTFCRVCSIPSYYCSIPFLWILVNAIGIWQQGLATQSNFFSPHVLFCSSLLGMHSFAAHIAPTLSMPIGNTMLYSPIFHPIERG